MVYADERLEPSRFVIIRWFGFDRLEPERAVTSYWVSSKTLLVLRIPIVLYSTVVMWASIGTSAVEGDFKGYFAFFTHLTFIGLHAYLVTAFVHHVQYLMSKPDNRLDSFFRQPAVLNYLFDYLYHTIVVFNIITPVVYWAALSGNVTRDPIAARNIPPIDWWVNTSVHGVSFVMMMFEVIMARMQLRINEVLAVFVNVILYMFLTFIVYGCDKWWVYPFLDWRQGPVTAGWYLGIGAAFIVVFFVQYLFHLLRDWIAKKVHRYHGKEDVDTTQQMTEPAA